MLRSIVILLMAFPLLALAEPQVSVPPPTGLEENQLEPEVRIIREKDAVISEYRMNGQLYMVRIEPSIGLPYYLLDMDGDGQLESRYNQIDPAMVVPSWMIYRW